MTISNYSIIAIPKTRHPTFVEYLDRRISEQLNELSWSRTVEELLWPSQGRMAECLVWGPGLLWKGSGVLWSDWSVLDRCAAIGVSMADHATSHSQVLSGAWKRTFAPIGVNPWWSIGRLQVKGIFHTWKLNLGRLPQWVHSKVILQGLAACWVHA